MSPHTNIADAGSCLPPHLQRLATLADQSYGSAQRLGHSIKDAALQREALLAQHEAQLQQHLQRHGQQDGSLAQPYQVPGGDAVCTDQAQLQQHLEQAKQQRSAQNHLIQQGGALVEEAKRLASEFWRRIEQLRESAHQTLMAIIRNLL